MKWQAITGIAFVLFAGTIGGIYVAALNAPVAVVAPVRPAPPTQNGAARIEAASRKIVRGGEVNDACTPRSKRKFTLIEKQDLLAVNRTVLDEAVAALKLPYYAPNTITSINDSPSYKELRHLAWLLTLAGDVAWETGRRAEATNRYTDAITLGRHVPNRVGIIGHLVGLACETIGRSHLWKHLDALPPEAAAQTLARLNALEADRVPFYVAVEEEKWSVQSEAVEALTHPERIKSDPKDALDPADISNDKGGGGGYGRIVPRSFVLRTLGKHMDDLIAQSKKPYIEGNREIPCPKELYTAILAPVTTGARLKYTVVQTGDALLRTALALRVYRAQTGAYPDALAALVTAKLLPAVPDDPFAKPGTALRYQATPDGKYVLYSIGPDGVDDNGRGAVSKSANGQSTRVVNTNSKGDMVAGWYTY